MAHQAPFNVVAYFVLRCRAFIVTYGWLEGRTDTMCKTNDHLCDRGLVGQQFLSLLTCIAKSVVRQAT